MWIFSHRSRRSSRPFNRVQGKGFTLIELVVVITIMLILTSVFLIRQQRFNSSTLLRSLAYSIALSIRQAQAYGTSIKESTGGSFNQLTTGASTAAKSYGIFFNSTTPNTYILFADLNNNGVYNGPGEGVQTFTIGQNYSISRLCAVTTGASPTYRCWSSTQSNITSLTVIFKRPNPDSCIATSLNANACAPTPSGETYSAGYVQLKGLGGLVTDTRGVTTTITGQISVGGQGS